MRLNVRAMAVAAGLLWGATLLLVGFAHQIWPGYGVVFLEIEASVWPGYTVGGIGSVFVGAFYALVDGMIGGAVFAWLYNLIRNRVSPPAFKEA